MIACLCLFIVLELATGFTQNLRQFLAVRSLYGIAMGGKLMTSPTLYLPLQFQSSAY
jgi:hypothetical protein